VAAPPEKPASKKKARPAKAPARPAARRRADGESTRARILAVALDLFRRKGFERATMREIAERAGLSLGAAYHYFGSKEEIALAFYREHLARHREVAETALASARDLRSRLEAVFASGLDVRGPDRPVLAALARTVLDVEHPLSLFADETRDVREGSIGLMREAVRCDEVPEDLREPLALALWALHLGLMLRLVLDDTPGQRATRSLMEGALDLVPPVVAILGSPLATPMREKLLAVMVEGGLMGR
jgi:AcrR family transcriptional regulator